MSLTRIRLTNGVVIFILTGVIYVAMEVFFAALTLDMGAKYAFQPLAEELYGRMTFPPPSSGPAVGGLVPLEGVKAASLIGASSGWMFFLGGLCGVLLYGIYNLGRGRSHRIFNLLWMSLLGAAVITLLELATGVLLNGLGFFVWDYTDSWGDLWGQICVSHTVIYFLFICPFGFWLFHFLEAQYPETGKKLYPLGAHYRWLLNPAAPSLHSAAARAAEDYARSKLE